MKKRLFTFILMFAMTLVCSQNIESSGYDISYKQTENNYTKATITVNNWSELKEDTTIDRICINASLKYNGTPMRQYSECKLTKDLSSDNYSIDLEDYGEWEIKASFQKGSKIIKEFKENKLGIIADQYNFVTLPATTPVLIFTLNLLDSSKNINVDEKGNPIPTFVYLTRKHWDWSELSQHTFSNPFLTKQKGTEMTSKWYDENTQAMKSYLKSLYNLNENSKFNLYVNDYHLGTISPLLFENNIPNENYTLKLITDGTGTYSMFANAYKNDASNKHTIYQAAWQEVKREANKTGKSNYKPITDAGVELRNMAYAIVDSEENAEWWVVRKSADAFMVDDSEFQATVLNNPKINNVNSNIGTMFNNALNPGYNDLDEDEFKALFNFDDSKFNQSRKNDKKIMMILGSSKSAEESNPIYPYVDYLMDEHGEEYDYYYKGHPGYPTNLYPERMKKISGMGMFDLDSSIPAELFIYFNPDINVSGYQSSTFQNAGSKETNVALFSITKYAAKQNTNIKTYADTLDNFVSNVKNGSSNEKIDSLLKTNHGSGENYLIEYQSDDKIAIYESEKNKITYYKNTLEDGNGDWQFNGSKTKIKYVYPYNSSFNLNIAQNKDEKVSFSIKNSKIATVDSNGKVKITGIGSTIITVTIIDKNKKEKQLNFHVTGIKATQAINSKKSYKVSQVKTLKLNVKAKGSLKYKSSNKNIVAVNSEGLIRGKKAGKATITITAKTTSLYNEATKKVTIYVKPKKQVITNVKSNSEKTIYITVKKDTNVSGYQYVIAKDKKFTKDKKSSTLKSNTKTTKKFTNVSEGKYYVKVRAYKTINGVKYYGVYSNIKSVAIK